MEWNDYIDWRRTIKAPQPEKCKGCVWGRFDGVKQLCTRPNCVKPELLMNMREWGAMMASEDGEFLQIPFEDRWHMYQEYKKRVRAKRK